MPNNKNVAPADLSRHERKCAICRHSQRELIEKDFLRWCSPFEIALQYGVPDRRTIYRHAHATGLFALRKRNARLVLEGFFERAGEVQLTADSILHALRVYTHITDDGKWIEPPRHTVITHEPSAAPTRTPARKAPSSRSRPSSRRKTPPANRHTVGLENAPTH